MNSFRPKRLIAAEVVCCLQLPGALAFCVSLTLTSISINPNPVSLTDPGQSQPLVATGSNDDGSSSNVTNGQATWTSSDPNTAFVKLSSTGVVTGIQNTTTPVTVTATFKGTQRYRFGYGWCASSYDHFAGSCSGNSISITTNGGTGSTVTLSSNVAADWTSSDSTIINISGTGTTSPSATLGGNTGTVTITATATSGGGSGTLQITVGQCNTAAITSVIRNYVGLAILRVVLVSARYLMVRAGCPPRFPLLS